MKICDAARARSGSNRRHFDGDPGSFGKTALIGFYVIKQFAKCNPGQLRHALVLKTDRTAPLFGLVSALPCGAYNTGGPHLVIYGTTQGWAIVLLIHSA